MDGVRSQNGNGGGDLGEAIAKARLAEYKGNARRDRPCDRGWGARKPVLSCSMQNSTSWRRADWKNILAVVIVDQALEIVRTRRD